MTIRYAIMGCWIYFALLLPTHSARAAFFDAQQIQTIGRYFKPHQIVILGNGTGADKGSITLVKDHRSGERFLNLQYAKAVYIQSKKQFLLLTIVHSSKPQTRTTSSCQGKKQAFPFKHPELGDFIICASQNKSDSQRIHAVVYPTGKHKAPHIKVEYAGTAAELMILLKSLKAYQ